VAGNFISGNTWKDLNFSGWATSAGLGAVGGGFSHLIGNAFLAAKPGIMTEVSKAAVHGQFNAILSGAMGGDPWAGYAAGFGGSLVGSYTNEWGTVARLGASMLVGGGGAALAGGDFMKGATVAGIGFLTNQLMHERPKFEELLKAFEEVNKRGEYVYSDIGGEPLAIMNSSGNTNACALRISYALNKSGIKIPNRNGTFKGADGKYYFLSAEKLLNWMTVRFGKPDLTLKANNLGPLLGEKGIYIMQATSPYIFRAWGHADLWYYNNCVGHCYFGSDVNKVMLWRFN
jgi:hypothetical protein